MIYPPPEIRNIVDKTAGFVAKNGPSRSIFGANAFRESEDWRVVRFSWGGSQRGVVWCGRHAGHLMLLCGAVASVRLRGCRFGIRGTNCRIKSRTGSYWPGGTVPLPLPPECLRLRVHLRLLAGSKVTGGSLCQCTHG